MKNIYTVKYYYGPRQVPKGQPLPAQRVEDEGEELWDEGVNAVQAQAAVLASVRQAKAVGRLAEELVFLSYSASISSSSLWKF